MIDSAISWFTPHPHSPFIDIHIFAGLILIARVNREVDEVSLCLGKRVVNSLIASQSSTGESGYKDFLIPLLGLPPSCSVTLTARFDDQVLGGTSINLTRATLPVVDIHPAPLMVTSVGRSGSTLLMQYLAAHPDVVAKTDYPMEAKTASNAFTSLGEQLLEHYIELSIIGQQDRELDKELFRFASEQADRLAIDVSTAYTSLHRDQCGISLTPVYYAEKNMSPEWLFWEVCSNAREIFLVRDPRDIICSSLAFNAKRGTIKFGRQDVETDIQYVCHRAEMSRPWVVEPWLARSDRAVLVKYEELATSPQRVLLNLFRYLDIPHNPSLIEQIISDVAKTTEIQRRHSTTDSINASIARWKRDLSTDMLEACNREFKDYLEVFEYSMVD